MSFPWQSQQQQQQQENNNHSPPSAISSASAAVKRHDVEKLADFGYPQENLFEEADKLIHSQSNNSKTGNNNNQHSLQHAYQHGNFKDPTGLVQLSPHETRIRSSPHRARWYGLVILLWLIELVWFFVVHHGGLDARLEAAKKYQQKHDPSHHQESAGTTSEGSWYNMNLEATSIEDQRFVIKAVTIIFTSFVSLILLFQVKTYELYFDSMTGLCTWTYSRWLLPFQMRRFWLSAVKRIEKHTGKGTTIQRTPHHHGGAQRRQVWTQNWISIYCAEIKEGSQASGPNPKMADSAESLIVAVMPGSEVEEEAKRWAAWFSKYGASVDILEQEVEVTNDLH